MDNEAKARVGAGFRVLALVALAAVSLAFLTASQISSTFLQASGAPDGLSAVAIESVAKIYKQNRLRVATIELEVAQDQQDAMGARYALAAATTIQYAHTVAFRQFSSACAPGVAVAATAAEPSQFDYAAQQARYSAIRRAPPGPNGLRPDCNPRLVDPRAIAAGYNSQFDNAWQYAACDQSDTADDRLECLWANLTTAAGLQEVASSVLNLADDMGTRRKAMIAGLDGELAAVRALDSPSAISAVASWLQLAEPDWQDAEPVMLTYATEPQLRTAQMSDRSFWASSFRWLTGLADVPGRLIAQLVLMPVLALSAAMAMAAGAFGGGLVAIWQTQGPQRAAAQAAAVVQKLNGQAPDQADAKLLNDQRAELAATLEELKGALNSPPPPPPFHTEIFLGGVAGLITWLLTTGGLFVLSGGMDANSASPNVLLALALAAGMVRNRIMESAIAAANGAVRTRTSSPA